MAPASDEEISPAEMRRWMGRLDRGLRELTDKVDALPFVRSDVYVADKAALVAAIDNSRQYVDQEIRVVDAKVAEVGGSLANFRSALTRLGWGVISAASVLGGGAFALFHK